MATRITTDVYDCVMACSLDTAVTLFGVAVLSFFQGS